MAAPQRHPLLTGGVGASNMIAEGGAASQLQALREREPPIDGSMAGHHNQRHSGRRICATGHQREGGAMKAGGGSGVRSGSGANGTSATTGEKVVQVLRSLWDKVKAACANIGPGG